MSEATIIQAMGGMVLFSVLAVKFLGSRALAQIDKRFDKLEVGQEALRKELTDYRIDAATTYVTKRECGGHRRVIDNERQEA